MSETIRVAVCVPNEARSQVESQANRLDNFLSMGRKCGLARAANEIREILEKHDADVAAKVMKEFWSQYPQYTSILGTKQIEWFFLTLGRIFTPLAREEAAKFAEEVSADYLFMIDDDMTCPNDLFERLFRHDVDIVAPLAFTRNFPHKAVLYEIKEGWDPVSRSAYFINHHVDRFPENALVEADAVGFGAVLIKMKVIKAMKGQRFMDGCTSGTGEDILFCHKARKLGFRVFMDTSTEIGHLSHPIEVTRAYVEKVRNELGYQDKTPIYSKYEDKNLSGKPSRLVLG